MQQEKLTKGFDAPSTSNPALLVNRLRAAASAAAQPTSGVLIVPRDSAEAVRSKLKQLTRNSGRGVAVLLGQLARDLESSRPKSLGIERCLSPDPGYSNGNGDREFMPHIKCHGLKEAIFSENVPLLLLDADADLKLNRQIFCRISRAKTLRSVKIATRRLGTFIQCNYSTFSKSHFLMNGGPATERGTKLAADIKGLAMARAQRKRKVVIFASQAVRRILTGEKGDKLPLYHAIRPDIEVTHFGCFIGQNRWASFDTAIIVGREEPPAIAMERSARAIFSDTPNMRLGFGGGYIQAKRPYSPRNVNWALISTHPDQEVQAFLELYRERQSGQAIDRLRLVHPDQRSPEIFLMCCLPIPGIVPDKLLTAKIIFSGGTRFQRAMDRRGLLTSNAAVLSCLYPDLWETPKAAEHDVRRGYPETPKMLKDNTLYANWGFLVSAQFRVPGQGGRKWSKSMFDPERCPYPEMTVRNALKLPPSAIVEFRGPEWDAFVLRRPEPALRNEGSLYYGSQKVISIRRTEENCSGAAPLMVFFLPLGALYGLGAGRPASASGQ